MKANCLTNSILKEKENEIITKVNKWKQKKSITIKLREMEKKLINSTKIMKIIQTQVKKKKYFSSSSLFLSPSLTSSCSNDKSTKYVIHKLSVKKKKRKNGKQYKNMIRDTKIKNCCFAFASNRNPNWYCSMYIVCPCVYVICFYFYWNSTYVKLMIRINCPHENYTKHWFILGKKK